MTTRIPLRVTHHGLKAAVPLLLAGVWLPTHHRPWWQVTAAAVLMVAGLLVGTLAMTHAWRADDCPACRPVPAARLTRAPYRVWAAYGRYGWLPALALPLGWIVCSPLVPALHRPDSTFNSAWQTAVAAAAAAYAAARAWVMVNHHTDPPRPVRAYVRQRCAALMHKAHWLVLCAFAAGIVANAAPLGDGQARGAAQNAATLLLLVAWYVDAQHGATLCETCVTEFPLDAAEVAARNRWRFTLTHRLYLAIAAGVVLAAGVAAMPHRWLLWTVASCNVLAGASTLLRRFHVAYRPWCPYCGRGGGGGHHQAAPDPSPGNGKPLPVA